jgi:hypothetical protein
MSIQIVTAALTVAVATVQMPAGAPGTGAPSGTATTRYCLKVDPPTGSRIATIQCRTREDWAALEVDVDQEWADNGVRVVG